MERNLLISEPPLQVLPSLAVEVGLNEAIILQQFHYWLQRSNKIRDGHRWIYNSYSEWNKQFPFWSNATIRRAIRNLEKQGFLISGNYNKAGFDKTKWYRIDYERLSKASAQNEQTTCSNWTDGVAQNEQTNTNRLPENTSIKDPRPKHKKRVYDKDSDYYKLSEFFISQIKKNNPNFKEPNIQKWSDDFRRIVEVDHRDKHEVAVLIKWVQKDSFWMANVLSPAKLKEKYDSLIMRMNNSSEPHVLKQEKPSKPKKKIDSKKKDELLKEARERDQKFIEENNNVKQF